MKCILALIVLTLGSIFYNYVSGVPFQTHEYGQSVAFAWLLWFVVTVIAFLSNEDGYFHLWGDK